MHRDWERTRVPLVASCLPWTTDGLLGNGGSSPPAIMTCKQVPQLPKHRGCSSSEKKHMARTTAPARRKAPNCFYMHLPKGKTNNDKENHSRSCFNLQACNPTHVLPARRRGGGPGTDLLSFVAGSADLYAEFGEQAEAVIRVWLHLCLTPLLTPLQPPIPAQLLSIYTSPGNRTLWPRPACKERKLPSVTQRILAMQGGYLQP